MPSFHRALTGVFALTTAVCCSPEPAAVRAATVQRGDTVRPSTTDRSIAARRAAILRLEADRASARGGCGVDAPGDDDAEPAGCDYARLFHALALFHTGGGDAVARANEDIAAAIAPLQADLRGANAITRAGKVRHAPVTFHFQRSLFIQRLIRSFGQRGAITRGALSADNERQLRLVAGQWASTYCRVADADPTRTWRIYQSENHHAQLVASCWAVADLARDGQGAPRYADGSTAAQQYARWTAYARAWLAQRVRYGLIEYFSPTYAAYTLETAYAYAQFADDPALRRTATVLLDRWWSDWAQQQIDGVFGGSMTRVYAKSVAAGSPMQIAAWAYFGIGTRPNPNPANAAALASDYRPPDAVLAAATRVRPVTPRCTRETAPGRLAGPRQGDWFTVDPALPAVLRTTCVAQGYVMGSAGEPVLTLRSWAGGSQQNEMAAIAFAGGPRNRIAILGSAPASRSTYNALVAVQDGSAMLVKPPVKGMSSGATGLRVWVGPQLQRSERDGWVFIEGSARAAIRPTVGGYRWDGEWLTPDNPAAGVVVQVATLQSGAAAAFQRAVLHSRVTDSGPSAAFAGATNAPLRLDMEPGRAPRIGARAVDFSPQARSD